MVSCFARDFVPAVPVVKSYLKLLDTVCQLAKTEHNSVVTGQHPGRSRDINFTSLCFDQNLMRRHISQLNNGAKRSCCDKHACTIIIVMEMSTCMEWACLLFAP